MSVDTKRPTRHTKAQLAQALAESQSEGQAVLDTLTERIADLELSLDDVGYVRLSAETNQEFSRDGLQRIMELCRSNWLKNPLIQRGVNVQRDYVWGQGVTIQAVDGEVDAVVQAFIADSRNQAELTSHAAQLGKEVELALTGNLFFVFFPNPGDGRVRVRTLPASEVQEIITDPDDAKTTWYYKRVWQEHKLDLASGVTGTAQRTAYYPDWRYTPDAKPATIGGFPVQWESPVYHVKAGGLPDMRFGVPEVYAALDWAKAYKNFLEDWATIVRAYSRFAWQLTTKKNAAGIAAAKTRLNTTLNPISSSAYWDNNPPAIPGSTFIAGEGTQMAPIRTSGATTSAEDGRRLLLMVAAVMGLPETFFGDSTAGSLATAKSLDRPTELKIVSRQHLWQDVLGQIFAFVILWAVKAGKLKGTITPDDDGTPVVELETDPDSVDGLPRSQGVETLFAPVIEHDVKATVDSIVAAAAVPNGVDGMTISRMLLSALGVDDVEAAMAKLYDADGNPLHEPPAPVAPVIVTPGATVPATPPANGAPPAIPATEAALLSAVGNVSRILATLKESNGHR